MAVSKNQKILQGKIKAQSKLVAVIEKDIRKLEAKLNKTDAKRTKAQAKLSKLNEKAQAQL